jgi:hypothetical protein
MGGGNLAAHKEMMSFVKIVLNTKDYFLKLNPICKNEEWDLVSYSDGNWVGNPETSMRLARLVNESYVLMNCIDNIRTCIIRKMNNSAMIYQVFVHLNPHPRY